MFSSAQRRVPESLVLSNSSANRFASPNGGRVDVLARDRELARLIPMDGARRNGGLWAIELRLDRGPWDPGSDEPEEDHLGFMVLDGLIGRRCLVPERGRSLELLGTGDLLRPWQEDAASFSEVSWSVIEPASVAVLGDSVAAQAREMPEFLEALTERALRRSRRLAVSAAIANTVGVEDRLLLLLWQLAELWGEKRRGGALLPFRLSHQTLADLVGARRPTVTLAVRALTERELLERAESGEWILPGSPP
jgi:CRP/FNR family transcriptional regulator, cyclic AMP receptor protein